MSTLEFLSLVFDLVLSLASDVLSLASELLRGPLGFERAITGQLSGRFLDHAPRFAGSAFYAVLVYGHFLPMAQL